MTARNIIENRLRQTGDLRFDAEARVEVWVTAGDLENDARGDAIIHGPGTFDDKKDALVKLAVELANEKIAEASRNGLDITCAFSPGDLTERVDWVKLIAPDEL